MATAQTPETPLQPTILPMEAIPQVPGVVWVPYSTATEGYGQVTAIHYLLTGPDAAQTTPCRLIIGRAVRGDHGEDTSRFALFVSTGADPTAVAQARQQLMATKYPGRRMGGGESHPSTIYSGNPATRVPAPPSELLTPTVQASAEEVRRLLLEAAPTAPTPVALAAGAVSLEAATLV